jgi:hypothetical protein
VGNLVQALGALLGEDGRPVPVGGQVGEVVAALAGRVGAMASELAQALGSLLGEGGSLDPASFNALAQVPAFPYERATALVERGGELVGELTQAAGALYGSGAASERSGGSPVGPPVAPIPVVPAAPGGGSIPAPLAGYTSFFGASGSAADAFQPLFAVVVLLALALLQGGKLFWYKREPLGPSSALVAAIERPG